jgi:CDP-glucose 4,6-dehydratase
VGDLVANNFLSVFTGRRVLLTGHTGFKGSWLAFLLNELGAEVLGYALPPEYPESHFELLGLKDRIKHVEGDIRDAEKLADTLRDFKPEFVFHLAAQALVKRSYDDPKSTFDINVGGSVNLLEAVRSCSSVRSLVFITSDKCYENEEWVWGYRENDRLGGHDPYSASKAAAEIVFSAYSRSFFSHRPELGVASTRAGNVIGGGDWAVDRIVPDCIRALRNEQPIRLRNPGATRPWQHVLEPLAGYLLLASRLIVEPASYSEAWNFGPPSTDVRTVADVAERIIARFGSGSIEIEPSSGKQHEARLLQLNCDKAQQRLAWRPRWAFEQTMEATAGWYKDVLDGVPVQEVTRRQLREFFPELA